MKRLLWVSLAAVVVVFLALVLPRALAQGTARSSQAPVAATAAPQRNWYSVQIVTVKFTIATVGLAFVTVMVLPLRLAL